MTKQEINWDVAPSDATHVGDTTNIDVIPWYKYEEVDGHASWKFWYSQNGILDAGTWNIIPKGNVPMHLPVTPRPKVSEVYNVNELPEWENGELPPVGTVCEFSTTVTPNESALFKQTIQEGTPVTIIAHFDDVDGRKIAAFIYEAIPGVFTVRQARAAGFRKILTDAEKEEIKVRAFIDELLEEINYPPYSEARDVLKALYNKGYIGK